MGVSSSVVRAAASQALLESRGAQARAELGSLLLFSSNACSYTTGQAIYIDGGWTCV